MVDLADPVSLEEKNVVKHSSQSPSISTVTTTSYAPTASNASPAQPLQSYNTTAYPGFASYNFADPPRPMERSYPMNGGDHSPYYSHANGSNHYSHTQGPFGPRYNPQFPSPYATSPAPSQMGPPESRGSMDMQRMAQPPGTCTRNLIGSLSGSAFKLKDINNEVGLWFVFQDLSVRTEGYFRLKFSFFDLMGESEIPMRSEETASSLSKLAPMLACTYSDTLHVYSAKKFPGVIESTSLSKHFAKQGIKIPIRKDGGKDGDKSGSKRKRNGADNSDGHPESDSD